MKKIIFTLALFAFSAKLFAFVYTPTLVSPASGAVKQSPNVLLDWNSVSGASYYRIQLDTNSSFTNPIVYTSTLTAKNASELLFGTKYYWRVKAIGSGDSSAWSASNYFTTFSLMKQVGPKDSTVSCAPDTLLKWTAVAGCTFVDVELDTTTDFNSTYLSSFSVPSTQISEKATGLHYGSKFYWRIRCRHAKDTSAWSVDTTAFNDNWCFFTSDTVKLFSPNDNSTNVNPDVEMRWKNLTGSSKFEYQTDTASSFDSPKLFDGYTIPTALLANNFANADTLDFGGIYFWRVRAINTVDTSEWSLVRKYTILNTVTLTAPTNGQTVLTDDPTLSWTKIVGSSKYEIEIDTLSSFTHAKYYYPAGTAGQYTLSALNGGQTYFWKMRAISSRDTSLWSNTWHFTVSGSGINDLTLNNNISVYPNPTSGNVFIKIGSAETSTIYISVLDVLGRPVREAVYSISQGETVKEINLDGISQGIYMMKITNGKESFVQKLTIR